MSDVDTQSFGVHCRTGAHDRCAMNPCDCPHHAHVAKKVAWKNTNLAALPPENVTDWELRLQRERERRHPTLAEQAAAARSNSKHRTADRRVAERVS